MNRNLLFLISLTFFLRAPLGVAMPIVDFSGGSDGPIFNGGVTYGYDFTVNSGDFLVTGLGVYESLSRPLQVSHNVGLWNSGGGLLASTTVDSLDSVVASISGTGQWRVSDIASLTLSAGTYYVGASYTTSGEDNILTVAAASAVSGITYNSARFNFGAGLNFPSNPFPTSLVGATVIGASVPVPATLALFGLGLAGLGWSRRKKA